MFGEMPPATVEAPLALPEQGLFRETDFDIDRVRGTMDYGRSVPAGRTSDQVTKLNLVRDTVLERMMSSQRTRGFEFYDKYSFGVTRGFLREAANRPDLQEGVRWLSLVRTRGFPTIEGAWQRISRSGRRPPFRRGFCPLCSAPVKHGWEWAHLLATCFHAEVVTLRTSHLRAQMEYLLNHIQGRGPEWLLEVTVGNARVNGEIQIMLPEVVGIYLAGGLCRHPDALDREEWFDVYQIGFGHARLITPTLEQFSYVPVASFLQTAAPLYLASLGEDVYGVSPSDDGMSASSRDSPVNQAPPNALPPFEGPRLDPDEAELVGVQEQ